MQTGVCFCGLKQLDSPCSSSSILQPSTRHLHAFQSLTQLLRATGTDFLLPQELPVLTPQQGTYLRTDVTPLRCRPGAWYLVSLAPSAATSQRDPWKDFPVPSDVAVRDAGPSDKQNHRRPLRDAPESPAETPRICHPPGPCPRYAHSSIRALNPPILPPSYVVAGTRPHNFTAG